MDTSRPVIITPDWPSMTGHVRPRRPVPWEYVDEEPEEEFDLYSIVEEEYLNELIKDHFNL